MHNSLTIQCSENISIMFEITGASPGRRKDSKNSLRDSTRGTPWNLKLLVDEDRRAIIEFFYWELLSDVHVVCNTCVSSLNNLH